MFRITSVKIKKFDNKNSELLGLARIVIDGCFTIKDIRIINAKRGMIVAFPSRKQQSGDFTDICHPLNQKTRSYFEDIILNEFKKENENGDNN